MPDTLKPPLCDNVQYGANPNTSWGRRGAALAKAGGAGAGGAVAGSNFTAGLAPESETAAAFVWELPPLRSWAYAALGVRPKLVRRPTVPPTARTISNDARATRLVSLAPIPLTAARTARPACSACWRVARAPASGRCTSRLGADRTGPCPAVHASTTVPSSAG